MWLSIRDSFLSYETQQVPHFLCGSRNLEQCYWNATINKTPKWMNGSELFVTNLFMYWLWHLDKKNCYCLSMGSGSCRKWNHNCVGGETPTSCSWNLTERPPCQCYSVFTTCNPLEDIKLRTLTINVGSNYRLQF